MRFNEVVFSALALGSAGLGLGCSDEARGVQELLYCPTGGGTGNTSTTGGTGSGNTSNGGKPTTPTGGSSNNDSGAGNVDNMAGDDTGPQPGACDLPWSQGAVGTDDSCDLDNLPDSGMTIQGDISTDLTLEGGKSYVLSGETRVMSGAVLTLGACTKIIGQDSSAILVILPGGKIEAVGTQDAPILFTSSKPKGERAPGDWGGLILLGNARHNDATADTKPGIEGLVMTERYGSETDAHNDESSGSLEYVRVEFVGKQIAADNEINGITFGAIGSGTKVSHVEVANSTDDCFEWFGGTVNADHLIALNCDDDGFDTDNGFSGRVQFAFGRQFPSTSEADSNGFEMDSHNPPFRPGADGMPTGELFLPLTAANWSNVTLCGEGPSDALSPPRLGAVLRRKVSGSITNTIFTGFADGGLKLLDILPTDASPLTLTHSAIFGNGEDGMTTFGLGSDPGKVLDEASANITEAPAGYCDCWSNPPTPFPLQPIEGATATGFPDAGANYVGAFKQANVASNWMIGKWVSWDAE
jgi:hypothetical protein